MHEAIKVLDHGYVRFVEAWGHGDGGKEFSPVDGALIRYDMEAGLIEAARQSTQGSFRGWEDVECPMCNGEGEVLVDMGVPWVTCARCEGKRVIRGDKRLLAHLFNNKPPHATPFEFAGMVIEVQAPIFVFREWHRHRTQSYNEMSARYAPLPALDYVPDWENLKARGEAGEKARNRQVAGSFPWNELLAKRWHDRLLQEYAHDEKVYNDALLAGVPKELARIKLPVGRYSRMRAQTNLRNWLAFMTLRADPGAQWEIQEYARAVGTILAEKFPRTWALYAEGRTAK